MIRFLFFTVEEFIKSEQRLEIPPIFEEANKKSLFTAKHHGHQRV